MPTATAPGLARKMGFLRNGFREIGRKIQRYKLRKRLHQQDREKQAALVEMGRRAWVEKVDISAFAGLREQLGGLETRANTVAHGIQNLEAHKQSCEGERHAVLAKFEAQRKASEVAKRPIDAALLAARNVLTGQEQAIRTAEARLAAIVAESAKIELLLGELERSTSPGRAEQLTAARSKQQHLGSEQARLQSELPGAKAASEPQAAEVNRLWQESQRHHQQIDAIEAERKSALAPLDAALNNVRGALSAAGQESTGVEKERIERFRQLGLALYQVQPAEPRLDDAFRRVAALDREGDAIGAALASSQGLTQTLPRGTMLRFWSALILAVVVAIGTAYGAYQVLSSPSRHLPSYSQSSREAGVSPAGTETREPEKDAVVSAFLESLSAQKTPDAAAQKTREEAVGVLKEDLYLIGSSADPAYLPMLTRVLKSDEPKLRAAAAQAMGMVRPSSEELPALVNALNDPVPAVRDAALGALEQVTQDAGSRLLVRRVQAAAKTRTSEESLTPEPVPDARQLGAPIFEGATFLHFASDLTIGRAAFATPDSLQKVLAFYAAKAGRPSTPGGEFTRMYFGGSADDPTGEKHLRAETQAWLEGIIKAKKPSDEVQTEASRRMGLMADLPLIRYADAELYGTPSFIALEEISVGGVKKAIRYVVVFEDHTLGRTGFEVHVSSEAQRN